jgi:hypothetical protein
MKSVGFFLKLAFFSLFLTFFNFNFSLAQELCDTTYHIDYNGPVVSMDGYYKLLKNGEKHFRTIMSDIYGGYEDTGWYYGYAYAVLYAPGTWTTAQTKLSGNTMQIIIKRPIRTSYDEGLIEWSLSESKASFCEWGDMAAIQCYPTPNMGYGHTVNVESSTSNCSTDTSGYNCNSSTGTCSYVSSGASYSSSSTCNANCSAPSGYSCGLDGTCSYCSDSSISGCDNVSLASCNSGCSCTNDSCDNLNMNNYCSGDYVCTGRCKGNRYGSYSCTPAERCVGMTYTCSASGVYQTRGSYEQVVCSSGACPFTAYSWLDYSMCGDDDPCRVETCGDSCEYNYCSDDTTIKRKTVGTDYDCYSGVSGGCLNEESTSCPPETTPETCEVGYVCREVPGTQSCRSMPNVDCVPKSSSWSEV